MRKLKAKIVRLNSTHSQRLLVDIGEQDRLQGEEPSLHHLLKARKRKAKRLITQVLDDNDILQTSSMSIMKVFSSYFRTKFQPIQVDDGSLKRLANCGVKCVTPETYAAIQEPITLEGLHIAITQGKSHKSPGQDGICLEFKTAWDVIKHDLLQIINLMYIGGNITARQLQGLILCLPKETNS